MAKFPDSAYAPVMEVYKQIPANLKNKANEILQRYARDYPKSEAPPGEMKRDLEALLSKNKQGGLEGKTNAATGMDYALGLISVLVAVAALSTGTPPLMYIQ